MAMFENIGVFFKRFMQNEKKELLAENSVAQSKDTAKDRLHIVLMQDRAKVSADFLEMMKEEIIEVIKKYIVVDESKIDVRLTNEENEDGSIGVPVLLANIPILNIRNDLKSEYMTHTIEDFNNEDNNDKTQVIQLIKETSPEVNHEITNIELQEEKNMIKDNEILQNDLSKQLKYETKEEIDKVEKGILKDDENLNIEKTEINTENEPQIEFINESENSLVEEIKLEDVDSENTDAIINEEKEVENKENINNSIENKKYEINYEEKVNDKYNKEKLENKDSENNKEQEINDNDKNKLENKIFENNKEQEINDNDKNKLENKFSQNNKEQKLNDNEKDNKEYKTNDKEYYKFEKEKQKSKLELTIDELDDEYDDDDDDDVTFDDLLKAAEEEEERLKQLNIQNSEENEKKLNKVKFENKNSKKKKKASKNRKK